VWRCSGFGLVISSAVSFSSFSTARKRSVRFWLRRRELPFKHISIIDLGKMVLPVPPIADQQQIVAKVDELMAQCDLMEASLAVADDTRRRLLEALLAEALAPAEEARELEAAE
jgi:hypothetical protein